jgi:neutral ceramidase
MDVHFNLRVGYAKREITPPLGSPLAGRPMLVGRRARAIRDSLSARAVHIEGKSGHITILVADLLLVTKALHQQVAQTSGRPPENLLVLATHTHSGPGGYWQGRHLESFMGPYDACARDRLIERLAETVREAVQCTRTSKVSAVSIDMHGMSTNRRNHNRPVDPVLTLLRFNVKGDSPICIVSFGAHPIVGLERRPFTITADYPGEICERLERLGLRPLFVQGACGGTSPAYFHLALEEHLSRLCGALVNEISTALPRMQPCDVPQVIVEQIPLQLSFAETRITPDGLPPVRAIEDIIQPLRRYLVRMAEQGAVDNHNLSLTIVGMGRVVFVGIPGEVGPELSMAIRRVFSPNNVVVASLCNGYAGYLHKRSDYQYEHGIRMLGLYENAMSLAGRDAGDSILSQLEQSRMRMAL